MLSVMDSAHYLQLGTSHFAYQLVILCLNFLDIFSLLNQRLQELKTLVFELRCKSKQKIYLCCEVSELGRRREGEREALGFGMIGAERLGVM